MSRVEIIVDPINTCRSELTHAHQIILNALAVMTLEQKARWARLNEETDCEGIGATRYHERAAILRYLGREPS